MFLSSYNIELNIKFQNYTLIKILIKYLSEKFYARSLNTVD